MLGALGSGLFLFGGASAWYLVAAAREDEASYEASKTVLSALTVTSAATLLLKATVSDDRPSGSSFDFPSGHASLSMATAASLDALYGHDVGIPAYILSGLIGIQRLDTENHDTGAVVFGWTLGYVIGKTIAEHDAPRIFGMQLGLVIDPATGSLGFSLSKSL